MSESPDDLSAYFEKRGDVDPDFSEAFHIRGEAIRNFAARVGKLEAALAKVASMARGKDAMRDPFGSLDAIRCLASKSIDGAWVASQGRVPVAPSPAPGATDK